MLVVSLAQAQKPKNFDPERFQRELEQFIATQACLSPAESAEFFPVYREMRNKQWAYFANERRLRHIDTSDDKACAEAIRKRDAGDFGAETHSTGVSREVYDHPACIKGLSDY